MKIGIDLGGSHIAVGVVNNKNVIVEKLEKRIMSEEKKDIKNSIETYIIENAKKLSSKYEITEMGIAVPGTVKENEIIKSVNLGIQNYKLVDELYKDFNQEMVFNFPIRLRNDAKCAAIAESKIGTLKQYQRSLFLSLGTGIGGAVVINGKLLDTGDLPGCEFGHIIIEKDGLKCNCGKKGCFERYASMKAFKMRMREELGFTESTSGKELLDIINKNRDDDNINRIIDEFVDYLSIGISNLVNIFEPEAVCIGGSFVYFANVFLERLKNKIKSDKLLFNKRDELIILPASLSNDAGIIGATL